MSQDRPIDNQENGVHTDPGVFDPEASHRRYRILLLFAASVRRLTGIDFLSDRIDENVTDAQAEALRFLLLNENASMGKIARGLGYTVSGATKAINRLEQKVWVSRQARCDDHREVNVALTPRGRELALQILMATNRRVEEIFSRMPPELIQRLEDDLSEFIERFVDDEKTAQELCIACGFEGGIDCSETESDCAVAKAQRKLP